LKDIEKKRKDNDEEFFNLYKEFDGGEITVLNESKAKLEELIGDLKTYLDQKVSENSSQDQIDSIKKTLVELEKKYLEWFM